MACRFLFRRHIEPRCAYCAKANPLDENTATCRKKGIVLLSSHCRAFKYDPLRRIPPKPAVLRGVFTKEDFLLDTGEDS